MVVGRGLRRYGAVVAFRTSDYPPDILSLNAYPAGLNGMSFQASINPHGQAAMARFSWGTNGPNNLTTVAPWQNLGSSKEPVPFQTLFVGQTPFVRYDFRIEVANAFGTSELSTWLHYYGPIWIWPPGRPGGVITNFIVLQPQLPEGFPVIELEPPAE